MLIEKEIANIMDDNKRKALQAALSQIEKQFGKGSIMRLGEHEVSQDIQVVSTGSLGLESRSGSEGCRAAGSWRSTVRNHRARRRSRCR
jgi:hypothetical protein